MVNRINQHTENRIREMVRAGFSIRQIIVKGGVAHNTAHKMSLKYRHEAPLCRHNKPLYECSSCHGRRRSVSLARDIIWLTPGPPKKAHEIKDMMSAEDILKNALIGALVDKGGV